MSSDHLTLIATHVSPAAAEALVAAFGGCEVYVPQRIYSGHPLARAVGPEAAREIAKLLGPGHVRVPTGVGARHHARGARILALTREGRSAREIARLVGCDVRTVYNWRTRAKRSGL